MSLGALKQLSISLGLYRPARAIHRKLLGSEMKTHKGHLALLSGFLKRGDLAFDVGANIGEKTDIMLELGAKVVAFEPQPALAREVRARGGKGSLVVVESAVGATVGAAELMLTESSGMASIRPDWDGSRAIGTIQVKVTTLDQEIAKYGKPAFCKIDVEGLEVDVLKGLSAPIAAVSFEYHCNEKAVERVRQCVERLSRLGNYEYNLTGTEAAEWLSNHWMEPDAFLGAFPSCAGSHFYGDVFARLQYPAKALGPGPA